MDPVTNDTDQGAVSVAASDHAAVSDEEGERAMITRNLLDELRKLTQALNKTSELPCNHPPKASAGVREDHSGFARVPCATCQVSRDFIEGQLKINYGNVDRALDQVKNIFMTLVADPYFKVHLPCLGASYNGDGETNETVDHSQRRALPTVDEIHRLIWAILPTDLSEFDRLCRSHEPQDPSEIKERSPEEFKKFEKIHQCRGKICASDNLQFIDKNAKLLFNESIILEHKEFLMAFASPSTLMERRSSHRLVMSNLRYPELNLQLQYHIRHFVPVTPEGTPIESYKDLGFLFKRQNAKIHHVPQTSLKHDERRQTERDLCLEERVLSLSLVLFRKCGTFRLIVLGDKGVLVENPEDTAHEVYTRIGIYPWSSGKRSGYAQFLVALSLLLESWHRCWNVTLDAIDDVVSFKMSHTLEEAQLNKFMFDSSGSMNLSRQYFTVLQVLRITSQWIDATVAEWETLKDSITGDKRDFREKVNHVIWDIYRTRDGEQSLEDQLRIVTELLTSKTTQLRERIDRKTEDVKSLRDGLFNATSLREAMKGMALNRAIYVFTAVTIVYTPLGFMAAIWALPILNTTPEGDNYHPSLFAIIATFLIVPIVTYISCGLLAWYFTSERSWKSFEVYILALLHVKSWPRMTKRSNVESEHDREGTSAV